MASAEGLSEERDEEVSGQGDEAKRAAIRELAGSMSGVYPPDEAGRLKEEWPE